MKTKHLLIFIFKASILSVFDPTYHLDTVYYINTVVVCTDLLGKEAHRQVGW